MTKKTAAKKSSKAKKSTTTEGSMFSFDNVLRAVAGAASQIAPLKKPHDRRFKVRLPSGAEAVHVACGLELAGGALVFTDCDRVLMAYGPSQWLTFEELEPEVVPEVPAMPAEPPAPVVQA